MYFPKLKVLKDQGDLNNYIISDFDEWLASQRKMSYDYLNPYDFINERKKDEYLSLQLFSFSSNSGLFEKQSMTPLLKIKYIVNCPTCKNYVNTFYHKNEIPNDICCSYDDECGIEFNPYDYPHIIEIYFELLDAPIVTKSFTDLFEKTPFPSKTLTASNDILRNDIFNNLW